MLLADHAFAGQRADGAIVYDGYEIDERVIEACLSNAPSTRQHHVTDAMRFCIGEATGPCMDANDRSGKGLYGNRTMISCAGAEAAYWQARVDQEYETLQLWAEPPTRELADRANSLAAMQSKWAEFIAAKCLSAASVAYGGREAQIHQVSSKMNELGLQALELEVRVARYCNAQKHEVFLNRCNEIQGAKP